MIIKEGFNTTKVPQDLRRAFEENAASVEQWNSITPKARRDWIYWIITSKLKETRARRIKRALENLALGKKRVCCFGGFKWLEKIKK